MHLPLCHRPLLTKALGTVVKKRARTKDQPGLWREVTAVAAEATCLLCLHKWVQERVPSSILCLSCRILSPQG